MTFLAIKKNNSIIFKNQPIRILKRKNTLIHITMCFFNKILIFIVKRKKNEKATFKKSQITAIIKHTNYIQQSGFTLLVQFGNILLIKPSALLNKNLLLH